VSVQDPLYPTDVGAAALPPRGLALRLPAAGSLIAPLALVGLVATTTLIALATARTGGLLPETMRPAPSWLAGPLGGTGLSLSNTALILVLVGTYLFYVTAISARGLEARSLIVAILAIHLLVVLAPPLFSTDMFSYQSYARLGALHGVNPYLAGPQAVPSDPLYSLVGFKWTATPTVYGPLFTLLSYAFASLSVAASVWAYKCLAAGASLLMLGLVWKIARRRNLDPVRAVALVGLNPLLVLYGVGGGHNDLLMLVLVVAGIYLVVGGRAASGSATLVGAAAIKLAGGLPLAFAAAAPDARGSHPWRRVLGAGAAAAAGVTLLGLGVFGRGMLRLPHTVSQVQSNGGWHSFPGFVVKGLHLGAYHNPISIGLGIVCLLICLWLLRRVWRGRLDWLRGAGWAAVAVLLTASSLLPWYVVWLLPLAALGRDRQLVRVAVVLSGVILAINLIDYFPHSSFVWSL
jgi:hypothetical protein